LYFVHTHMVDETSSKKRRRKKASYVEMDEGDDPDESGMEVLRLLLQGGRMKVKSKFDEEYQRAISLQQQVVELTTEQLEVFKGAFSRYDKQNNATIRYKSLIKALRKLGQNPTEDNVYSILNTLHSMGKEVIQFIDFVKIFIFISSDVDEVIREAFSVFDTDGSGSITHEEFRVQIQSVKADITPEEVDEIILEADVNGDGEIDLLEFSRMLQEK